MSSVCSGALYTGHLTDPYSIRVTMRPPGYRIALITWLLAAVANSGVFIWARITMPEAAIPLWVLGPLAAFLGVCCFGWVAIIHLARRELDENGALLFGDSIAAAPEHYQQDLAARRTARKQELLAQLHHHAHRSREGSERSWSPKWLTNMRLKLTHWRLRRRLRKRAAIRERDVQDTRQHQLDKLYNQYHIFEAAGNSSAAEKVSRLGRVIVDEQQYLGYLPAAIPDDEIADAKDTHWLRTDQQRCIAARTHLVGADPVESTKLIAPGREHTGHSQASSGSPPSPKDRRLGTVIDIADRAGLPISTNPPHTLASMSHVADPGGSVVVTGDVEEVLSTLLLLARDGYSNFIVECDRGDSTIFECLAPENTAIWHS